MKIEIKDNIDEEIEEGIDIHTNHIIFMPENFKDCETLLNWMDVYFHREIWMDNEGKIQLLNYSEWVEKEIQKPNNL